MILRIFAPRILHTKIINLLILKKRMKKFFTFFIMAALAINVNAQENLDIEGLPITLDNWNTSFLIPKTDVNAGDKFLFVCEEVAVEGWSYGPQLLPKNNADWSDLTSAVIPNAEGIATFEVSAENAAIINASGGLRVQGMAIKVNAVQYAGALEYAEGVNIEFDQYGNLTSDKFAGFSDNAKVEFTIQATGEATGTGDNEGKSIIGWGIGSLKSLDNSVKIAELGLQKIGDNVYSFTISELKAALEAPANEYNMQGISFSVWNQGNAICSRKSVVIYEVKSTEPVEVDPAQLWTSEEAVAIGWNDNIKVTGSKLTAANAKVGDIIKVIVSDVQDNHQVNIYQDWGKIYGHQGKFMSGETEYTLGLTKGFFDALSKGFFVAGSNVKVNEVRIVEGTAVADDVIWFGDYLMTEGHDGLYIQGMSIPAEANSIIVEVEGGGEDSWLRFSDPANGWSAIETDKVVEANTVKLAVNDVVRQKIGSIVVHGGGYRVKSLKYSSDVVTGISTVTAAKNDGIRYNAAGQKVSDSYKGLIIINGRKVISK